jgi:hypothetical protein
VITSHKDVLYLGNLAKKYQNVLIMGNASELLTLTKDVRRHPMRGLANLAKFNGCYEEWQNIIKKNGLKWKQADDNFNFFEKENINEMLDYVRQVVKILPTDCGTHSLLQPCLAYVPAKSANLLGF